MEYFNQQQKITPRFWNGTIVRDGKKVVLSIHDPEDWKDAIDRAIKDLMPRTLERREGVTGDFNEIIRTVMQERAADWFGRRKEDISEEQYDSWHAGACTAVLDVLRQFYTNNDKKQTEVQYGKAQKIVNMSMKELYCLQGAGEKETHFKHCHIALDSYTLEWVKRNIFLVHNETQKRLKETLEGWMEPEKFGEYIKGSQKEPCLQDVVPDWQERLMDLQSRLETYHANLIECGKRTAKKRWKEELLEIQKEWIQPQLQIGKVSSWSMVSKEGNDTYYGYDQYVGWIRNYFNNCGKNPYCTSEYTPQKLTAFQAEFYIWPEIQLHVAAEAFYGQDIGSDVAVEYMLKYLGKIGDPDKLAEEIRRAKDPFKKCIKLFQELPLSQKMKFLEERIQELRLLYPEDEEAAVC